MPKLLLTRSSFVGYLNYYLFPPYEQYWHVCPCPLTSSYFPGSFSNGRSYLFIYESKYLLSICYVPAMVTHMPGWRGDMVVHTKAMSFCFCKEDSMSPT